MLFRSLSQVFEYGQGYVALSRVRRLTGLYILGWNEQTFQVHPEILSKDKEFRLDSDMVQNLYSKVSFSELQKRQDDFIKACDGKLKSVFSEKLDTYTETLLLWNEGETVSEIAKMRKFTEGTILSHIEKLVLKGKIKQADLSRILTPSLKNSLPKIHAVFNELNTDKLHQSLKNLTEDILMKN